MAVLITVPGMVVHTSVPIMVVLNTVSEMLVLITVAGMVVHTSVPVMVVLNTVPEMVVLITALCRTRCIYFVTGKASL